MTDSENDRAFGNSNQLLTTDNNSKSSNTKTPVPKFVTIGRGSDAFVGKKQGKRNNKKLRKQNKETGNGLRKMIATRKQEKNARTIPIHFS